MDLKILIADDHAIFREGLRSLFEKEQGITVVGEAGNGNEAVELSRQLRPDVVLMDITMPGLNGIEATRRIVAEGGEVRVLAFSMESDRRFVVEVLEAGASGYVLKEAHFKELIAAVRAASSGSRRPRDRDPAAAPYRSWRRPARGRPDESARATTCRGGVRYRAGRTSRCRRDSSG